MKRKKGISLIVLIITIVVIVILATAVILSIANNNPIENASEAVEKNNRAEYESELSLYIAKQYADNKGEYDPSTELRCVVYDEIRDKITSMTEKDKENYIIWQGELYKKEETSDGIRYVNSDGERAKFLDEETEVIEKMIEFLKAFNEKQEELDKDEQLLYNGGYITGITGNLANTLSKLPDGCSVENSDETNATYCSTNSKIVYKDETVAIVVKFGDVYVNAMVVMNNIDANMVRGMISTKGNGYSLAEIISADINHDGIVNLKDADWISKNVGEFSKTDQRKIAIVPKFE